MSDASLRSLVPLALTLAVLAVVGVFVARVLVLYNVVQKEGVLPSDLGTDSITISPRLAATIARPNPNDVFDVVSDDDPSIGNAEAKLTIVEFADFGCPFSREASFAIRALALTYGDRIRYIYRDFPIPELHPDAQAAAEAGECADDQGKFWAYHDMLFQNQNDLSRPALRQYAASVGLNLAKFDQCMAGGRHRAEVLEDYQAGIDAQVFGTPTFFFNGQPVSGAIPLKDLQTLIEAFL
ncbi:MAG: DSBA oxidoreductase [Parcubacteria group bacterium GW2011_GWA2_56_7]|nr:MAG: DSBA oxidoreductase [Parcubacteria group bacterium GW2011_GWA2_56_7]